MLRFGWPSYDVVFLPRSISCSSLSNGDNRVVRIHQWWPFPRSLIIFSTSTGGNRSYVYYDRGYIVWQPVISVMAPPLPDRVGLDGDDFLSTPCSLELPFAPQHQSHPLHDQPSVLLYHLVLPPPPPWPHPRPHLLHAPAITHHSQCPRSRHGPHQG